MHYHTYERIAENEEALVEICTQCKKRLTTKKDKRGRIDNEKFRKEHVADFAQPHGATGKVFKKLYGENKN